MLDQLPRMSQPDGRQLHLALEFHPPLLRGLHSSVDALFRSSVLTRE
jgi:hypothetical protein